MTSLGWPIPVKPAAFTPEGAPEGVEVKFVTFWRDRVLFAAPPRSLLAHTNGAQNEGSIDSAWNWAHAKPGSNTLPHYQVDRTHGGVTRARKMLPTNRVGIANATVMPGTTRWPTLTAAQQAEIRAHGQIRLWSLAIETADLGWPTPARPDAPGGTVGFDDGQGELLATIIAYEAIVAGFPVVMLSEWWGAGVGAHTDPDGYPFTTTAPGKPCPGDAKKRDMREWIIPRAAAIAAAWLGSPIVIDPPPTPTPTPTPGDTDMASSVLILEDARPPHAVYKCGPTTKSWVQKPEDHEQLKIRIMESAGGTKPAIDGFVYTYMRHGGNDVIASYGPIDGPVPDGHDAYGRH